MPCEICTHPNREEIEAKIAQRASAVALSAIYQVNQRQVSLHAKVHMEGRAVAVPVRTNVLDCLHDLDNTYMTLSLRLESMQGENSLRAHLTAATVAHELRNNIESRIKIVRELGGNTFNWPKIRDKLLRALEPFPDAQDAVMKALEENDDG